MTSASAPVGASASARGSRRGTNARDLAADVRSDLEVIFIGPRCGAGGVGDYASDISQALREIGLPVQTLGSGGAGRDGLGDAFRLRRALSGILSQRPATTRTIIHFELSAASLAPFWALATLPAGVAVTATVHDPPHAVWWPLRTRLMTRAPRVLTHAVHYPFRGAWWAVDDRALRNAALFTLSHAGAMSMARLGRPVTFIPHYIPQRPPVTTPTARPMAVGLFGYSYGGKGFENLAELRRDLPSDVELHVAGRGTERIPAPPGVRVWGAVDDAQEAAFFSSIRCLMLPYDGGGRYGPMLSVSGAAARSYAYGTPVVAPAVRAFAEDAEHGALLLACDRSVLATRASSLIHDETALASAASAAGALAASRTATAVAQQMQELWCQL